MRHSKLPAKQLIRLSTKLSTKLPAELEMNEELDGEGWWEKLDGKGNWPKREIDEFPDLASHWSMSKLGSIRKLGPFRRRKSSLLNILVILTRVRKRILEVSSKNLNWPPPSLTISLLPPRTLK